MTPAIINGQTAIVSANGIGLFGGGLLLHPLGLSVAVSEIEPDAGLLDVMKEVRPVLDQLIPEMRAAGLETEGLGKALTAFNGSKGRLSARQAFSQLTRSLESYTKNLEAYQRATDQVAQGSEACSSLRYNPEDATYQQKLKDLHRLTLIREEIARGTAHESNYASRFRETYLIATGGQAFVHYVEELDSEGNLTGRQFVARRLKRSQSIARLYDYAQAVSRLDHPHIVKTHEIIVAKYDSGESDLILLMEPVDGESLEWYLKNSPDFSETDLLQILTQQLSALDHAHENGVIHRDVKPSNIMLRREEDGTVQTVLIDFGLAKLEGNLTRDSSLGKGTVDWMAPEQIFGNAISEATDYHGLGLLLLSLAMGKTREDRIDFQKPTEDLEELKKKGFSENFLKIIEGLTAEDPQTRRKTAQNVRLGMGLTTAMIPAASLTPFPQAFPEVAYPSSEKAIPMLVKREPSEHFAAGALQFLGAGVLLGGGIPLSFVAGDLLFSHGWKFLGLSSFVMGVTASILGGGILGLRGSLSWFQKKKGNKVYLRNGGFSFGPNVGEPVSGEEVRILENIQIVRGDKKSIRFTNEFILQEARRMSKNEVILTGEIGGERLEVKIHADPLDSLLRSKFNELLDYPPGFRMHLVGKFDKYGFFRPRRFGPAFRT